MLHDKNVNMTFTQYYLIQLSFTVNYMLNTCVLDQV